MEHLHRHQEYVRSSDLLRLDGRNLLNRIKNQILV